MDKKSILTIVIVTLLFFIVWVFWYGQKDLIVQEHKSSNQTVGIEDTDGKIDSVNDKDTLSREATIKQLIIKAGIDLAGPFQDLPYELRTRNGHYLLYVYETKKLMYDGQEVYSGEDLKGMALSPNGLHYAYVLKGGSAEISRVNALESLYIDKQKVHSATSISYPAITDDGQHYFYTDGGYEIGDVLYKDGQEIFRHASGILGFWTSTDGSRYLASLRNIEGSNFVESLVMDGKEIYKGSGLKEKVLSDNGQHYGYITTDPTTRTQTLIVDGVARLSSSSLNDVQITNTGEYAGWDSAQANFFVNDKVFAAGRNLWKVVINDNVTHILTYGGEEWILDGKAVKLPEVKSKHAIRDAEVVGDMVYVYALVE